MHLHRFTLPTVGGAVAVLLAVGIAVAQRGESQPDDRFQSFTSNPRRR
jgi:hypothetical protein